MSTTIVSIQNPGDAEATNIVAESLTPTGVIEQYGSRIAQGAFVALTDRDFINGNTQRVSLFVADRVETNLYLQNNELMQDENVAADPDNIGAVIASGQAPLASTEELETFTVFGVNDDGENFSAVVSATEDTVHDVGIKAGLVDEGWENSVKIDLIVKGDALDLERVSS